jgi:hypothetical protein
VTRDEFCNFADPAAAPIAVGADLGVFANVNVFADDGVGADADIRGDLCEGRDNRCGMHTCRNGSSFHEQCGGFGKG